MRIRIQDLFESPPRVTTSYKVITFPAEVFEKSCPRDLIVFRPGSSTKMAILVLNRDISLGYFQIQHFDIISSRESAKP